MPYHTGIRRLADFAMGRLVESAGYRAARHIELAMQWKAVRQTADYVETAMMSAVPVRNPSAFLRSAVEACRLGDGLVLECGVWRGSSIRVLSKLFPNERIYGFDSFEGLPESWRGGFQRTAFAVAHPPKVPTNVELIPGWFKNTLVPFLAKHEGAIKFLHIDCDLYSSTIDVLNACAERLIPGSVIAFDEYFNYPGWREGEFKAWQEFVTARGLRYEYLCYTIRHEQVAIRLI